MRSHFPDYPQIYMPITLILNHEIICTNYTKMHSIWEIPQLVLVHVNLKTEAAGFQSLRSSKPCLKKVLLYQRIIHLEAGHLNYQLPSAVFASWPRTAADIPAFTQSMDEASYWVVCNTRGTASQTNLISAWMMMVSPTGI